VCHQLLLLFFPPLRPAEAFCAFVPPWLLSVLRLPEPDALPPLLEEPSEFAMRAARDGSQMSLNRGTRGGGQGNSGRRKLRSYRRTQPDSSRMRSAATNSGSTPNRARYRS
jgi:hypothetical protein